MKQELKCIWYMKQLPDILDLKNIKLPRGMTRHQNKIFKWCIKLTNNHPPTPTPPHLHPLFLIILHNISSNQLLHIGERQTPQKCLFKEFNASPLHT